MVKTALRPNESLEPTTGRCAASTEGKIMKDEVKTKLDSACRGLSLFRYADS